MKEIDIESWSRATQYHNFIAYSDPTFSVGTQLDVTELLLFCKQNDQSFFSAFLYLIVRCMNEIENWRLRIVDNKVILFDKVHPSYVVLRADDSIVTCMTEMVDDYERFYRQTREDIERARHAKDAVFNTTQRPDCVYVSCLPWIRFTSLRNPYHLADRTQTSIPRITWGRYAENNGRYEMAFDISAHHALADGIHVARLFDKANYALNHPKEFLGGSIK